MKLGYVGVPAPEVLEYDSWFGHPPETEKSIAIKEAKKLAEEHKQTSVMLDGMKGKDETLLISKR